MFCRQSI